MKDFASRPWVVPQPVLIVFAPIHHSYVQLGEKVGNAFSDGKALK